MLTGRAIPVFHHRQYLLRVETVAAHVDLTARTLKLDAASPWVVAEPSDPAVTWSSLRRMSSAWILVKEVAYFLYSSTTNSRSEKTSRLSNVM